jgi:phage terminase large subunit-like protein
VRYLCDVEGTPLDAESFNALRYLADFDTDLLQCSEGRRLLTKYDPLLFALVYLSHHLTDDTGEITFADWHLDWYREAISWAVPNRTPRGRRQSFIAPRNSGKSTTWMTIIPLWVAAHGFTKVIAAFSGSGVQAQLHLASFRRELERNELLRFDFPGLCTPEKRDSGQTVADTQSMLQTQSGFAFIARGIRSSSLGLKVNENRPDIIILDDIEQGDADFDQEDALKVRKTMQAVILPMSDTARTLLVGTAFVLGSIIHDLVCSATGDGTAQWILDERFRIMYHTPIVTRDDGSERSSWAAKWSLEFLHSIMLTAEYAQAFLSLPINDNSLWWQREHMRYGTCESYDRTVIMVDGAVTVKKKSDFTGVAAVGVNYAQRKFYVLDAIAVKLSGEELRRRIIDVVVATDADYIMCEANQGGDLWYTLLHDMPVNVSTFTHSEPKKVRIKRLLTFYQREGGAVLHARKLPQLERVQLAYPNVLHEDVLDAVAAGVQHQAGMLAKHLGISGTKASAKQMSFMRR